MKGYFYERVPLGKYVVPAGTEGQICHQRGRWPDGRIGWHPHTTEEEKTYTTYGLADNARFWLFQEPGSEFVVKIDPKHVIGRDKKRRVESNRKPWIDPKPPVRSAMTNRKRRSELAAAKQVKKEMKQKKEQKQRDAANGPPPIPQMRPGGRLA